MCMDYQKGRCYHSIPLNITNTDFFSLLQKMKGLMRKRSTTAARLQRAFSAKGLRGPNGEQQHNNNRDNANNNNSNNGSTSGGLPPNRTREGRPKRQFIMETPVTFTTVSHAAALPQAFVPAG